MSISSEVRKAGPFAGNDVATAFPFAFKVFSTADVLVVEANALGAESTLDLGTDYTISLNADQNASPGGTVTLSAALATGKKLVLSSQVAQLQPVDLTNSGGFYPDVINKALDRATILIQQLAEKVDRAIKVTLTSGLTPDEFVAELQQGASDASASAAAAAASAAEAATFDPDLYQLKAYGNGTVSDVLDGGQRGDRNLILNGGFEVRQDAETTAADGGYLFDVFYALTETGSVGVSRLTHAEAGAPYALRLTQPDASPKRFGFAQAIPSGKVGRFRTAAMHLAARLRLSAAGDIRYALLEHTGTADSITRDVVNNWASTSFTAGGFFIAGVTVLKTGVIAPGAATFGSVDDWSAIGASANNLIVAVWTESAQAQNVTLDCARIQLEPGVVETPHAWRDDELTHVRWIYERSFQSFGGYMSVAGQVAAQFVRMQPKRVVPAVSIVAGSRTNLSNVDFDNPSTDGFRILHIVTGVGQWAETGAQIISSARL